MRIWDKIPPENLCRQHLLAQWREGLGLWNILTQNKKGYSNHPETKRWRGFEGSLWNLLANTRKAMILRGWNPKQLPDYQFQVTDSLPASWDDQISVLKAKKCMCKVVDNVI